MFEAIALSFGLAMDATAVSGARGMARHARREQLILPLVFGAFQAGMAALGHYGANLLGKHVARWDHWIAFGLLVGIGLKMLWDAWSDYPAREEVTGTAGIYFALGLATSIDAAAAGITMHVIPVATWLMLVLIGGVTLVCSALGYAAGWALEKRFGSKLEVLGGLILIGIGIELLVRGL